ncbi:hypothetical protein L195_g048774 [Trifolium pratense]|uniref:Uncharacterized protein n=1 Tax=Trifolium pratense TaxID=57577 RepID=A0A2K3JM94_TRIPR|nr:hypothetical protein L195_g048774 [Trifolium pratense]
MLYPQDVMIKGLPYLAAGPDQAHLDTKVWFPMEMLVPIQGLGRYYAGTEGFGFLWNSSQVQTGAEIAKHSKFRLKTSEIYGKLCGALLGCLKIVMSLVDSDVKPEAKRQLKYCVLA